MKAPSDYPVSIEWQAGHVIIDERYILREINLTISSGEFVAVLGPNGAGKSTFLRALAGLIRVEGYAAIPHRAVNGLTPRERSAWFSYLPQDREVAWPMPVREVVALGRGLSFRGYDSLSERDLGVIAKAVSNCGLSGLEHRPVTSLSGGERARVLLARALVSDAPFLIADEPTAFLDPARQMDVMDILAGRASEGRAVVAVLHDVGLALRYATRMILLHRGRKVGDGTPQELLEQGLIGRTFGVDFHTAQTGAGPAIAMARRATRSS
ncbi:MAG: cobalamin/Fe3+-siderophore transporter, ATPase subunit [Hyphomicrobiales bacterium]|jgi:iron complex transport system ATP-binding protein|nr:cobalamin/Fe3+-siderophore transporter, ATPase subunit [Hyphomicrobiales bacterium]